MKRETFAIIVLLLLPFTLAGAWFTGMEYQTYLTNEDRVIEEKYLKAVCASRIEYEREDAYGEGVVNTLMELGLIGKEGLE